MFWFSHKGLTHLAGVGARDANATKSVFIHINQHQLESIIINQYQHQNRHQ